MGPVASPAEVFQKIQGVKPYLRDQMLRPAEQREIAQGSAKGVYKVVQRDKFSGLCRRWTGWSSLPSPPRGPRRHSEGQAPAREDNSGGRSLQRSTGVDVCPGWKRRGRAQWDFPCLEPMQKPCGASSAGAQPSTAQRDGSEGRLDARNMSVVSRTTVPTQTLSRWWSLVWSVLVSVLRQHWRPRAGGPWESYVSSRPCVPEECHCARGSTTSALPCVCVTGGYDMAASMGQGTCWWACCGSPSDSYGLCTCVHGLRRCVTWARTVSWAGPKLHPLERGREATHVPTHTQGSRWVGRTHGLHG